MTPKYRKRPQIVEARQFTGDSACAQELLRWWLSKSPEFVESVNEETPYLAIATYNPVLGFLAFPNQGLAPLELTTNDWLVWEDESFRVVSNERFVHQYEHDSIFHR